MVKVRIKCTLINSDSIPILLLNEFYTNIFYLIFHSIRVETYVKTLLIIENELI